MKDDASALFEEFAEEIFQLRCYCTRTYLCLRDTFHNRYATIMTTGLFP